jgi:F-type H+-transporting ATPase subunit alpha
VLLDDAAQVEAGDTVTGSGEVVRVPVGEALLGRVVDPLGRPLDGGAPIRARRFDPVERPAPAIIERDLVVQPVQTGTLAIDAMFAIGRGSANSFSATAPQARRRSRSTRSSTSAPAT